MKLQIKKFVCTNPRCKKKVFSQRLPSGIRRYSRRTERAEEQLTQLSLEVSGRKGSWISKLIRIPVSPSTCLRMANKCDVPVCQGIRYIGIDDWAYRKGHTYGTILVDRETGKAVDLIKSREKEDITLWLKAHPGIETVTCDRAECYSQSADMALPGAVQITDRFHLIVNYSDCVAKISRKLLPELRKIKPERLGFDHAHDQEIQQIIDLACGRHVSQDKKGLIIKAKELYRKGYSMRRITRILQLNFRTVHKYIENDIGQIQTCRTLLIDYSSYIETLISGYRKGEKLSVVYRKRPANKLR
jgi:Transposase and inactivated derivatives